jgi:hypothetical protein
LAKCFGSNLQINTNDKELDSGEYDSMSEGDPPTENNPREKTGKKDKPTSEKSG